jgi:hypothetical protein
MQSKYEWLVVSAIFIGNAKRLCDKSSGFEAIAPRRETSIIDEVSRTNWH